VNRHQARNAGGRRWSSAPQGHKGRRWQRCASAAGLLLILLCLPAGCAREGGGWLGGWRHAPKGEVAAPSAELAARTLYLQTLDLSFCDQQWGSAQAGCSVEKNPLTLQGKVHEHGVGTHAYSALIVDLKGAAERFQAVVGVDDESADKGSVVFAVVVDGEEVVRTDVLRGGGEPQEINVDLAGARQLILTVEDGGDGIDHDHADWANARLVLVPGAVERPLATRLAAERMPLIASGTPRAPALHAPRVTGATPGRPFLFRIPATGEAPLRFEAANLPPDLTLDSDTGIITGTLAAEGTTAVPITVTSPCGTAGSTLTIVGGHRALAQTPPMGWNSWNVWGTAVDDAKVRAAADYMVSSGLASHGYQYINIDDAWEGQRDAEGRIQTNEKFPDMKALADYVHSKGLKLGIYSSPGPKTCADYEASYQHEQLDANTYAEWGIDLLKYDWCSYEKIAADHSLEELRKPYLVMREALDNCGRDIVYSLCQYGMGNVWEWGATVGGNYWRTTGDIWDSWSSMAGIGFGQNGHEVHAGPGHWNDPDMLVVGQVGWGPELHATRLTPDEQITHITLWSLLAAPLLIGCDLSQLDDFTLAVLTNTEVLEVNQDPLGKAAGRVAGNGRTEVWARPLADGALAVGLFNRGVQETTVTAEWEDLGIKGCQAVRDLWRRRDIGHYDNAYTAHVPPHGAMLLTLRAASTQPGSAETTTP